MFADLDEVLEGDLKLKVKGKVYVVKEPTALEGLKLQRTFNDPERTLDDAEETLLIRRLFGPVWDQMLDDDVPDQLIMFSGRTALLHYALGAHMAEAYVRGGVDDPGNPLPPGPRKSRGSVFARMSAAVRSRVSRERTATGTPAEDPSSKS